MLTQIDESVDDMDLDEIDPSDIVCAECERNAVETEIVVPDAYAQIVCEDCKCRAQAEEWALDRRREGL